MSASRRTMSILGLVVLVGFDCKARSDRDRLLDNAASPQAASLSLTAQPKAQPKVLSAGLLQGPRIAGFRHERRQSKFALGTLLHVQEETTADGAAAVGARHVGTHGVFMEWANGFTMAIPNADAASDSAGPFSESSIAHNERVVRYFTEAGLPVDQIHNPHVITMIRHSGTIEGAKRGEPPTRELIGFNTVIDRTIDSVPVADSYAWARFNKNDEVVAEQVWWPELPLALHDEIASFRSILGDMVARSSFRAKLPKAVEGEDGTLCVHHSMPTGYGWYLKVTLDFVKRDRTHVLSFDRDGVEVKFSEMMSKQGLSDVKPGN